MLFFNIFNPSNHKNILVKELLTIVEKKKKKEVFFYSHVSFFLTLQFFFFFFSLCLSVLSVSLISILSVSLFLTVTVYLAGVTVARTLQDPLGRILSSETINGWLLILNG